MTATINKVKRVTTISLGPDAPFVKAGRPYKLEVTEYADKGKVTATEKAHPGRPPMSTSWSLYGYQQYQPCPEWVVEVLSEAGWSLQKVWSNA